MPVHTLPRFLALVLPLMLGCANGSTLNGSVNYDGQAVEDGHITFIPVEGTGGTAGAPISNGKYRIAGISPSKYKVQFLGNRSVPIAKDDPNAERFKSGTARQVADLIPPDADGNNQVVDVTNGSQVRDFNLKKPASK